MTQPARPAQVAVCGPGDATPEALSLSEAVGAELGRQGITLICGGLGGCMEAACRGASAVGGTTIGVIPGYDARAANPYVDTVICTGMGQARNAIVVASGAAVIAIGGGAGTLSEVAMAIRLGKPVVLLGAWPESLVTELVAMAGEMTTVVVASDAAQAVAAAMASRR